MTKLTTLLRAEKEYPKHIKKNSNPKHTRLLARTLKYIIKPKIKELSK